MIPETVTLRIPFFCGCRGSVQAWGYARNGVSMEDKVDKACLVEDIPDEEYREGGAREGMIVVEVPVKKMFEEFEVKGAVE